MNILNNVTLSKTAFTWDPNNSNYSTDGMFDPAKLKAGTGSCYLSLTTESIEVNLPNLSRSSASVSELNKTYIVGVGVVPP